MEWLRFWIAEIGVPAAIRPMTGIEMSRLRSSAGGRRGLRLAASPPSTTLGVKRFWPAAPPARLGQANDLERPGAVGQAANEAPLFKRGDQAVDAGFRFEIERVLHFVKGGRNAGFAQAFMDEAEQFVLFSRQHGWPLLLHPVERF